MMSQNQWAALAVAVALLVVTAVFSVLTGVAAYKRRLLAANGNFSLANSPVRKLMRAKLLIISVPLLITSVVATVCAWTQMDPGLPANPAPPTSTAAPQPTASLDPVIRLPMCAALTGQATAADGYVLVVGVHEVGDGNVTWYERARVTGSLFTVEVELGSRGDHKRQYELTPVWMRHNEQRELVQASKNNSNQKNVTYFGIDDLPLTGIAGPTVRVTRSDHRGC